MKIRQPLPPPEEHIFSFRNTITALLENFPKVFVFFLFLMGGFMAGALNTEHRMLSPNQPLFPAQSVVLSDKVTSLPLEIEALVATITSQTKQLKLPGILLPSSNQTDNLTSTSQTAPAVTQPTVSPLPSGVDPLTAISVPTPQDHYQGNLDAKIVLIEYGDFECPYCAQFEPTMNQLTQEYGDKIGRVFRHFPLDIHPHAEQAAEASECVTKQLGNDGFWKFNDSIFAQNTAMGGSITPDAITKAALDAGADMNAFNACLSSGEMAPVVKADQDEGLRANFGGTPSTVMIVGDGQRFLLSGAVSHDDMKKFIDSYL